MKRVLASFIVLLIFATGDYCLAQKAQYGPHTADYGINQMRKHPQSSGISNYSDSPPYILYRREQNPNNPAYVEARFFVDFEIPQDSTAYTVPYPTPEVAWVDLRIEYTTTLGQDTTLRLNVYNFADRISTRTPTQLWDGTEGADDFPMNGGMWSSALQMYMIHEYDDDGALKTIVQNALSSGHLSLGFKLQDHIYLECHEYWIQEWDIQLTIGFVDHSQTLEITNTIDGTKDLWLPDGQGGSFSKVRDEQIQTWQNAPYPTTWQLLRNHYAETRFWEYTNIPNSADEKFIKWDGVRDRYFVKQNVNNYNGGQTIFAGWTAEHKNTTLTANMEFYTPDVAEVDFHDPWKVYVSGSQTNWLQNQPDGFHTEITNYTPQTDATSYGVFLDQESWYPAKYRLRPWKWLEYNEDGLGYTQKSTSANLEIGDGIFYAETATEMDAVSGNIRNNALKITPVNAVSNTPIEYPNDPWWIYNIVYRQDNSTVTPLYKAHRGSANEGQPTSYCSQRKVDIDADGNYHMVYESSGGIWYSKSTDDGVTWSPEKCVSGGYNLGAKNPCIAVAGDEVFVVYVASGTIIIKHTLNGVWDTQSLISDSPHANTNSAACYPVIDVSEWFAGSFQLLGYLGLVAWENDKKIECRSFYVDISAPGGAPSGESVREYSVVTLDTPLNPDYSCAFPTISCVKNSGGGSSSNGQTFMVAWWNNYQIRSRDVSVQYNRPGRMITSLPMQIAPVSVPSENAIYAPSVTCNNTGNYVASYEVRVPSGALFRRYFIVKTYTPSNFSWNTTATMVPVTTGYQEALNPTIGYHQTSIPNDKGLRVVFHKNWGGGLRVANIGTSYQELTRTTNGTESFASVVAFAPYGDLIDIHSVQRPDFPTCITWGLEGSNQYLQKETEIATVLLKAGIVTLDSNRAIAGIYSPKMVRGNAVEVDLEWNCVDDTLVVGDEATMEEKIRTQNFEVENGSKLNYTMISECVNPTAFPTGAQYRLQIRRASDNSVLASIAYPINQMLPDTTLSILEEIHLQQFAGETVYAALGIEGVTPAMSQAVADVWLEFDEMAKIQRHERPGTSTATSVELAQNHPNPFNPSTLISFTLPEAGHVKLVVSDNLGRDVRVLVEGDVSAGMHSYTFDASGLNSGLYHYRLETNGAVLTRKMQLIK